MGEGALFHVVVVDSIGRVASRDLVWSLINRELFLSAAFLFSESAFDLALLLGKIKGLQPNAFCYSQHLSRWISSRPQFFLQHIA